MGGCGGDAEGRNSISAREGRNFARGSSSSAPGPQHRPAKLRHQHPFPCRLALLRRPHCCAAPDPSNCPLSPTTPPFPATPGPIPTKFPAKLAPTAWPVPDNRWAVAPAGPGLSWPGPLHSSPTGARGRLAPGRGGELAPLPPPYLPYCRVTSPRRPQLGHGQNPDVRLGNGTPAAAVSAAPAAAASAGTRRSRPSAPTTPHSAPSRRPGCAGLEGKGQRARAGARTRARAAPRPALPAAAERAGRGEWAEPRWVWGRRAPARRHRPRPRPG